MEQPLISVIVPVYKTELYLRRCVDSIRKQTYQNLEIILIDDGSPDRCGEMCDAFAQEDPRIVALHQKNAGQSAARNLGLDYMHGTYVGFVDSDDWIEPDFYQRLYTHMIQTGAQISACGTQWDRSDGRIAYFNQEYPRKTGVELYATEEALRQTLINQKITYSLCDKLYRREIFGDLRLTVGKIYEDMELLPRCVEKAERVVYDPQPLYHYNVANVSTIRGKFNLNRFAEVDVAKQKMEDYRVRYPQLYHQAFGGYVAICLKVIHFSTGVAECEERRQELIRQLRRRIPLSVWRTLRRNDQIKLVALKLSPRLFEWLMKLRRG